MAAKKWRQNNFRQNIADDCVHPEGQNRSILNHFLDKCIFAFNVEIQDGHQKWRESDFWQTVVDDSMYTLWVKKIL